MTPSVPDWGLGRAVGVGATGAGWGLWPLSARQGANGPIGGGSGTRTSACTDISPTSLHDQEQPVSQCRCGFVLKQVGVLPPPPHGLGWSPSRCRVGERAPSVWPAGLATGAPVRCVTVGRPRYAYDP